MPKEISDKLTYDDLKLGEKAVDMYEAGATPEEIARSSPVYLNTSPVFNNLNVTDLAIAGVLGGFGSLAFPTYVVGTATALELAGTAFAGGTTVN